MRNLLVLMLMIFSLNVAYAKEQFNMVYFNDWKPFSWEENGEMKGLLIDIIDEALHKRVGLNVIHKGYPWMRAQEMVKENEADAFITAPLPFRKEYTEVSKEKAVSLTMACFVKNSNPKIQQLNAIKKVSDLMPFRLGAYLGGGWPMKNLKGMNVDWAGLQTSCLEKLDNERIDIFIDVAEVVRFKINEMGMQNQIKELPNPLDVINFHLCVGKKSSYVNILSKYDGAIRNMKNDGTLKMICKKYSYDCSF